MAHPKGTFNEYLGTVDQYRRQGRVRTDAHWQAINMRWPEMANRINGGNRDPRHMGDRQIDDWLGWLVAAWNRVLR